MDRKKDNSIQIGAIVYEYIIIYDNYRHIPLSIRITYPDDWTLERKRLENRGSTVFLNQCNFTIWQYRSHPSI